MSSQDDELERIQDRLNRARGNRAAGEQPIPPAPADSSVTSRIRASAGSTTAGTWESISMASPLGMKKTFTKASSSRRIVAQDQSINLRGQQDGFSPAFSPEGGTRGSGGILFNRDSSSRNIGQPPFSDEYNDAAPNAESEEYLDAEKNRNRLSPIMAMIVGACMDCYTSLAYHADRLYLNCARGGDKSKMINGCMVIVATLAGVFTVLHFTKSSPSSASEVAGGDSSSFLPSFSGRAGDISKIIVEMGVTSGEVLNDKDSIQYQALQWVANKDPAKLPADKFSALVERYILAVFYYSSNPAEWTHSDNWMTGTGHCAWYGVECIPRDDPTQDSGIARSYDDNAAITGITLSGNNLVGTLPPELGKLSNTLNLDFGDNYLTGEFPEMHENLKYLLVPNNGMQGSFPAHFKKLANLHGLDISNNAMHGYVTEDIHFLTNLRTLDMSGNSFGGSFPAIHLSTKITKLHLHNNKFHGTIPSGKLRDYERLEVLRLDNNTFTGPFPKQSVERLKRIEHIDLSHNDLTGSIPDIFQHVRRLSIFHLNNNRFRSTIPDSLMNLSGLRSLRLDHNVLTGKIPDNVALLADLQHFDLHDNMLSGQIPTYIGFPDDFTFISLKNNKLTGTIPSEMANLFRLSNLELDGNQLTGSIPSELATLSTLTKLTVHDNDFAGISMPVGLCDKIRKGEIEELSADCINNGNQVKVTCDCCTCY